MFSAYTKLKVLESLLPSCCSSAKGRPIRFHRFYPSRPHGRPMATAELKFEMECWSMVGCPCLSRCTAQAQLSQVRCYSNVLLGKGYLPVGLGPLALVAPKPHTMGNPGNSAYLKHTSAKHVICQVTLNEDASCSRSLACPNWPHTKGTLGTQATTLFTIVVPHRSPM